MKLQGNTVLSTGGSGGIGLELASQLVARGNTVIVTGREQAALEAAQRKVAGLRVLQSDVRDARAIASLYQQVVTEFPAMNVLINNAGIMRKINLQTFGDDLADITAEIDVNLSGPVRMVMQFLPLLLRQVHPAIVNVSSGLAFIPFPISPVYGATKAGLHSFTQSLRVQLRKTPIQVFEIAPPATATALNDKFVEETRGMPLMATSKLVSEALKGLESDRPEIRVGLAKVLKFMSRVAPSFMLTQLSKSMDLMHAQMKQLNG